MSEFPRAALGVCYYPEHWPEEKWADDAARMADLGLSWVRIGEFAWSRLEPSRGRYDFDWLERAMAILGGHGLKVVLGTPTATPPKWLVDAMPEMLPVGRDGRVRGFGSRRHYCFSHQGYREECARIVTELARRFGKHPAVGAWQTDNEYGCHDTTLSFSEAALAGFRTWLARKYQSPDALNRAWGNVFWSMEYAGFEEIGLPSATVAEANPAHWMDFRRFASEQVVEFNRLQTRIIRKYSPGRDVIHNFMGRILDFDHFDVAADLDVASWDSYPLGFLADRARRTETEKLDYMRAGDPDFQAFHHDLYRAVGRSRWWVMEQQPGPVNWAPYNPDPRPGMVRLWSWEAFAHGAETVSYFRWRQAPFAQEQMHAGLLRPDDLEAAAMPEIRQLAAESRDLGALPATRPAAAAILFDYSSAWAWQIQPQGDGFDYFFLVFEFYRALRALGIDVDFVNAGQAGDLSAYRVILVPGLFAWPAGLLENLGQLDAAVIIGPRTGSRTPDFSIPPGLAPQIEGLKVERVDTLPAKLMIPVVENSDRGAHLWRECLAVSDDWRTLLRTADGWPVFCRNRNLRYLAAWPSHSMLLDILREIADEQAIAAVPLPPGLRTRSRGDWRFCFNYANHPVETGTLFAGRHCLLGSSQLEPGDVAIFGPGPG